VFLLSPKSCLDPWSKSGDRELDLEEFTIDCVFWYTKHVHYTLVWI
jgi:hypothetical protein